ncbi:hypothetical protein NSK_008722 [Nannochloropsis salina CCMP1776]|uniref:Uncharacterized protein n=1 Tax=Nannochloropsis salina CCMP1776 TaxID=1027361 RepID=A0A4D9CN26_9STRA|nr:hypothetical protein NSK_008722 [Nannochloropsis salina CCMP1776]|eukprot:TFJ79914.1 hypothetical protein NSK_008722 [Nannochloropsis salina CCMP1776]
MAAAPPSGGMEGVGPRQPSGLGGNVGLGGISTEGMEDLPKYDEEIAKCKRFLLEFEDGEVVNIEGGEDDRGPGVDSGALPPAATETWRMPRVSDVRLDWCSAFDKDAKGPAAYLGCGQPAADAFCRSVGYASASNFKKDEQIEDETMFIDQRTLNTHTPKKDAFRFITCMK